MAFPFALAGLGISTIGNIFGASANSKANKLLESRMAEETAYRDTAINQDPLKSNVGRNIMKQALDRAKTQAKTVDSGAAVTGASAESRIAQKGNIQKGLSDTASNIAAYATAREDSIEGRYRSDISGMMGQKIAMLSNQAQSASNLASNASGFMQSLAPAVDTPTISQ